MNTETVWDDVSIQPPRKLKNPDETVNPTDDNVNSDGEFTEGDVCDAPIKKNPAKLSIKKEITLRIKNMVNNLHGIDVGISAMLGCIFATIYIILSVCSFVTYAYVNDHINKTFTFTMGLVCAGSVLLIPIIKIALPTWLFCFSKMPVYHNNFVVTMIIESLIIYMPTALFGSSYGIGIIMRKILNNISYTVLMDVYMYMLLCVYIIPTFVVILGLNITTIIMYIKYQCVSKIIK